MSTISPLESQISILRETSYYRMDKLVWEMRQAKSGLEMKIQKTFFSSIPNACTGKELVHWLRTKLLTPTETEALHLANALCRLGYIVPVNEKQTSVKQDNSCYRIQRPALWPSRKWDSTSQEYAVHLLRKVDKGKSLENHEQMALRKMEQIHSATWSKLMVNAKESVSKYNRGSKTDREIEDSQDRSFWRVHRPPPGQKMHDYRAEGFARNSVCMEVINQNRKTEILEKKIMFMKIYLEKSQHHSEQIGEKTINILMSHCTNYEEHDPLLTKQDMTNPWIAIDEYFYEDLIELDERKHTRLDLESWTLGFRELLNDCYGKQLFASFLQQEYSMENLQFWEACEDLKQSPLSKVPMKIERIRRDFLQTSSKFEVNLDRLVLQSTLDDTSTPTSRFCMDTAQHHIYNLMKNDCYPRFLKSDTYRCLLLSSSDKHRENRDSGSIMKIFQAKRDRRTSTTAKLEGRRGASPARSKGLEQRLIHSSGLISPHSSVSPYYMRRSSNVSPNNHGRNSNSDSGYPMRKAGSLSSLVVSNTINGKKKAVVKAMFEDDIDRVSNDSGTFSGAGVYSTATCSPKTKTSARKLLLKKKMSVS